MFWERHFLCSTHTVAKSTDRDVKHLHHSNNTFFKYFDRFLPGAHPCWFDTFPSWCVWWPPSPSSACSKLPEQPQLLHSLMRSTLTLVASVIQLISFCCRSPSNESLQWHAQSLHDDVTRSYTMQLIVLFMLATTPERINFKQKISLFHMDLSKEWLSFKLAVSYFQ